MRDRVDDDDYLLQRALERALAERHPDRFVPRYSMVTFQRMPYATAFERGRLQRELLVELTRGHRSLDTLDWDAVDATVRERLAALTSGRLTRPCPPASSSTTSKPSAPTRAPRASPSSRRSAPMPSSTRSTSRSASSSSRPTTCCPRPARRWSPASRRSTRCSDGVNEAAAFARIFEEMARPETCSLGYNSLRFDDEFVRYGLFRNFYDAYEREWRGGNSRWDLLDVLRLAHALRPEGLVWPQARGRRDVVPARTPGRSQRRARRRCARSAVGRARADRPGAQAQGGAAAAVGLRAAPARQALRRQPDGRGRDDPGAARVAALPGQPHVLGGGAADRAPSAHRQPRDRVRPRPGSRARCCDWTPTRSPTRLYVRTCRPGRRRGTDRAEGSAQQPQPGAGRLGPPACAGLRAPAHRPGRSRAARGADPRGGPGTGREGPPGVRARARARRPGRSTPRCTTASSATATSACSRRCAPRRRRRWASASSASATRACRDSCSATVRATGPQTLSAEERARWDDVPPPAPVHRGGPGGVQLRALRRRNRRIARRPRHRPRQAGPARPPRGLGRATSRPA